jgi:hypothetical protein
MTSSLWYYYASNPDEESNWGVVQGHSEDLIRMLQNDRTNSEFKIVDIGDEVDNTSSGYKKGSMDSPSFSVKIEGYNGSSSSSNTHKRKKGKTGGKDVEGGKEKKPRALTPYNRYMKIQIGRLREDDPDATHAESFKNAAASWSDFKNSEHYKPWIAGLEEDHEDEE